MPRLAHLYLDDSGTRHPDRALGATVPDRDWFALGGVLINQEDEDAAHAKIDEFRSRWEELGDSPLHSSEIRHASKNFAWLKSVGSRREEFLEDLQSMWLGMPVRGIACVIHRPGYNERYRERYGAERWRLCKTAFTVVVERAAKVALKDSRQMRVFVERASKEDDRATEGYYVALRAEGNPFSQETSGRYEPLTAEEYRAVLYEFRTKRKQSRIMQIADLYLHPICQGGYDPGHRPFAALREAGRLIDCGLAREEVLTMGIKYSCFERV